MARLTYPHYDMCLTIEGYSLQKDFDNIYLGWDNFLEIDPTCKVKAVFASAAEVTAFYQWWETNTRRGVDPWIVKLDYFGEIKKFGVLQESPLVKKIVDAQNTYEVTFGLRIIFGEDEIYNAAPVCESKKIYIPENTRENYIRIGAEDVENDPFVYDVQVPTAYGILKGKPPALLYTPDPGFKGTDCFSYVVSDYFNVGEPCIVEIVVDNEQRPDHVVRYEAATGSGYDEQFLYISGNFHYSFDNVIWRRGFGGRVTPYTTDKNTLSDPSFTVDVVGVNEVDDSDWILNQGTTGSQEIVDGNVNCYYNSSLPTPYTTNQLIPGRYNNATFHVELFIEKVNSSITVKFTDGTAYTIYEAGHHEFDLTAAHNKNNHLSIETPNVGSISMSTDAVKEGELLSKINYIRMYNKIDTNNLWIASNDHVLNTNYPYVKRASIEKWGSRTDFKEYLFMQTNLDPDGFTCDEDAGDCLGTDFTRMFAKSTIEELAMFAYPEAESTQAMFANSQLKRFTGSNTGSPARLTNGKYMFYNTPVEEISNLYLWKCQNFEGMFQSSTLLRCISRLNTLNQTNTSSMFSNTPSLTFPTTAEQTSLESGYDYIGLDKCGIEVTGISKQSGSQTCETTNTSTNCTSSGVYKVSIEASSVEGVASYQWYVSNGTINGSDINDTVTVDVSSSTPKTLWLSCVVTDSFDGAETNSGSYSFIHKRTYSTVYITIPKSYSRIDLKALIDAHVTTESEITITNNVVNCSMYAHDFPAAWNVTLVNNSEIQGIYKGNTNTNYSYNHGLYITSSGGLKLLNNGYIRGAGGYGGTGSKGADDSYNVNTNHSETRQDNHPDSFWAKGHSCQDWVGWDGHHRRDNSTPSPCTIPGVTGTFTIGSLVRTYSSGDSCVTWYQYQITRKWTTSVNHSRTGGNGGGGGYGCGYNHDTLYTSDWRNGSSGGGSSPSGGNSGGTGGYGGWWGNTGQTGRKGVGNSSYGSTGKSGAPAIAGEAYLDINSNTGSVSGAIT